MKIIVQRNIIDTELIYQITEIEGDVSSIYSIYNFDIKFLEGKELRVQIHWHDKKVKAIKDYLESRDTSVDVTTDKRIELSRIAKASITSLRSRVVKIWMENQTTLPQLELE